MLEIIFHIGMGKTGTSSIQETLFSNSEALIPQGVHYLGMWFDIIDQKFQELPGQQEFFSSSPQEMTEHAQRFIKALQGLSQKSGCSRFILSNEEIFAQVASVAPFIEALRSMAKVRILAYVRDPRDWLPSAYFQWSIFHKNYEGPVISYRDMSKGLVETYSGFRIWNEHFREILTVRAFDKSVNVVADFAGITGIKLASRSERVLERMDLSEGLLRVVYNSRLLGNTLPSKFDSAFPEVKLSQAPRIRNIVENCFDFSKTEELISEYRSEFEYIKEAFGIDLFAAPRKPEPEVNLPGLRGRILEMLLYVTINQADQIRALEEAVAALRSEFAER